MGQSNTSGDRTYNAAAQAILRLLQTMKNDKSALVIVERRDLELLLACWQVREERRAAISMKEM